MCGIIGYSNDNTTKQDLLVLKRVLIESRIRGMHASGIAWYNGKKIQKLVVPTPIDNLMKDFDMNRLLFDGRIAMIGHTRYSTSDLNFNQPLTGQNIAIAHNGVITQRHPKYWESEYGYECQGKNDSELLLRAIESGDNPFKKFPKSSISYVSLDAKGAISAKRNGKRPLWKGTIGEGIVYASTYDILNRAGVKNISKILKVHGVANMQWRDSQYEQLEDVHEIL